MGEQFYTVLLRSYDNRPYVIKIKDAHFGSRIVGDLVDFDAPMIKILDDLSDFYDGVLFEYRELWNFLDRLDVNTPLVFKRFDEVHVIQLEITVDYLTSQLI